MAGSAQISIAKPPIALVALALIVLFGTMLRFWGLDRQSFWFDEAVSVHYARRALLDVIRSSFVDEIHPPGFYLVIHFWSKVVGIEEWVLRLPSAASASASLILMYTFARNFAGRTGSLVATAILATSPLHIWYAHECRAYATWVLFVLAAYICFFRWLATDRWLFLLLNGLFVTLAVSFHYFGLHLVLIENLFLLAIRPPRLRPKWKEWFVSQALLAAMLVPFILMILLVDRSAADFWKSKSSVPDLQYFKSLAFHLNGVFYFLTPERPLKATILFLNLFAFIFGLYALRKKPCVLFLALAIIFPILANAAFSLLVTPILGTALSAGRYFLLTLPPYIVVLAIGWEFCLKKFGTPRLWSVALACLLILYALGIRASWKNTVFTRDDNRRLCRILLEEASPGDWVVAWPFLALDYYAERYGHDLSAFHMPKMFSPEGEIRLRLPGKPNRIWLLLSPRGRHKERVARVAEQYSLTLTLVERENGISGVGLFRLDSPERDPGRQDTGGGAAVEFIHH